VTRTPNDARRISDDRTDEPELAEKLRLEPVELGA
jgi:hypothetical protein